VLPVTVLVSRVGVIVRNQCMVVVNIKESKQRVEAC